jgi:ankyrin repeat protein
MGIGRKGLRSWLIVPLLSVASLATSSELRLVDAVEKRDKEAVRLLLNQRVDVNAPQADGATALAWAAYWDDLETADLLIGAGANVNVANEYGVTPLSIACTNGSAAMVEILLMAGADPNAALLSGETALMTATETGSLETVKLLLAHGANVNATEPRRGQNALMWAVAEGHSDIAQALIEHGANIHARSKGGFTPLLFAAQQGDVESARILLATGASVNEGARPDSPSALLIASASGHSDFPIFLLDKGADPNQTDSKGFTSLHYAAMRRNMLELVKALLAHGANPNARLPKDAPEQGGVTEMSINGATPLFLAAAAGNANAIRALAAAGADPSIPTADNSTALMVAAGVGLFENRGEEIEKAAFETVRLLVELGSDVNALGEHGWTALHGAAYTGADATIQFLVEKGARMDVMDDFGQTPLSIAQAVVTPGVVNDAYKRARAFRRTTSDLLLRLGAPSLAASRVQILQALPEDYSPVTTPEVQGD